MAATDELHYNTIDATEKSTYFSEALPERLPAYTPLDHTQSQHHFSLSLGSFPWRDVVVSSDGSPAYFADISEFTPNAPDIALHAGDKEGPVAGAAHFRWSRSIRAGLGSDSLSMDWMELKRAGTLNTKHFDFEHQGQKYSLRRTRDAENGVKMMSHYQVARESDGAVVGDYRNEAMLGRLKGQLSVASGTSRELEILIVLGVVAWREKARRRQTRHVGATGG